MQSKPKSNSVITHAILDAAGKPITLEHPYDAAMIRFIVRDVGELDLPLGSLHPDVARRAMIHGLIQRISDAAAISRNTETGMPADAGDKAAAMERLVVHYASGNPDWTLRKAEGGGREEGLTVRAMCDVFGVDTAGARAMAEKLSVKRSVSMQKALSIFAQSDKVAARIAEIRAERANVSADDLLSELEGEDDAAEEGEGEEDESETESTDDAGAGQ